MYLASCKAGFSLYKRHSHGGGLSGWQGAEGKASELLPPLSLQPRNHGADAAPTQPLAPRSSGAHLVSVALLIGVNGHMAGGAAAVGSQGAQVFRGDIVQLLILVSLLVILFFILSTCSAPGAVSQLLALTHSHGWACYVLALADMKLCTFIARGSAIAARSCTAADACLAFEHETGWCWSPPV